LSDPAFIVPKAQYRVMQSEKRYAVLEVTSLTIGRT